MITRARLLLECPQCRESKLINVTIMDDAMGPVICDTCVARAVMDRRMAGPDTVAPDPR
jgi:hypothetical protein